MQELSVPSNSRARMRSLRQAPCSHLRRAPDESLLNVAGAGGGNVSGRNTPVATVKGSLPLSSFIVMSAPSSSLRSAKPDDELRLGSRQMRKREPGVLAKRIQHFRVDVLVRAVGALLQKALQFRACRLVGFVWG